MAVQASMTGQGDGGRPVIGPAAPIPSSWSVEEFKDAFHALDEVELGRLEQSVAVLARIGHCEPGDIIQEVYTRVLERRRIWPKDMALGAFVVSAGRSIINAKVRHRKRSPYRDAESVNGWDGDLLHHGEDPQGSPEDQVILLDLLERAEKEIPALFEDDEAAALIWLGRQDGLEGEPLRELTGLDKTDFASKRRLVQRRLISYRNGMGERR